MSIVSVSTAKYTQRARYLSSVTYPYCPSPLNPPTLYPSPLPSQLPGHSPTPNSQTLLRHAHKANHPPRRHHPQRAQQMPLQESRVALVCSRLDQPGERVYRHNVRRLEGPSHEETHAVLQRHGDGGDGARVTVGEVL